MSTKEEQILGDVIQSMANLAAQDHRKHPLYKVFQEEMEDRNILNRLSYEMMRLVLVATQAMSDAGLDVSKEQFYFLLKLPYESERLEKEIRENEGSGCCVDKTYSRLQKRFEQLGKKITP